VLVFDGGGVRGLTSCLLLRRLSLEIERADNFWSRCKSLCGVTNYDSLIIKSVMDNYERAFACRKPIFLDIDSPHKRKPARICNRPCKFGYLQSEYDAARGTQPGITAPHGSLSSSCVRHVDVGTGTRTDESPERKRDFTTELILPMIGHTTTIQTAFHSKEVPTLIPCDAEIPADTIRQFHDLSRGDLPVDDCAGPMSALQDSSWPLNSPVLWISLGWTRPTLGRIISSVIAPFPHLLVNV